MNTPTEFSHGPLRLTVDERGSVAGISFRGDNVMLPSGGTRLLLTINGSEYAEWDMLSCSSVKLPNGTEITQEYSSPSVPGLRVWQIIDIYGDAGRIERWVHVAGPRDVEYALTKAVLAIEGLTAGAPDKTEVSVPMTRVLPGTPLSDIAKRAKIFDDAVKPDSNGNFDLVLSAPDLILGTVTFSRPEPPLHLMVTPFGDDIAINTRVFGGGDDHTVVVEHEFAADVRLWQVDTVTVGEQAIQLQQKDWRTALPALGKLYAQRGFVPPEGRPEWAKTATIYEADLEHHESFAKLATRLDDIVAAGFDTLYLMPWGKGIYANSDYLTIHPGLGSFDDLRALTDAAHAHGLKVLFDLLLVVAVKDSPYLIDHPEWFYRDAAGAVLPHPVWNAPCLDPASPGFREYLTQYAVRCCSELGADGFRVDAPGHRGGSWGSTIDGLQPCEHSAAVFTLLDDIREAIREVNPDAILMAETFGPELVRRCDLVCWQWIFSVDWLVDGILSRRFSGRDVQRIVAEQVLAQPPQTWLSFFTVNHDTLAFSGRDLEGPGERTLWATLALIGAAFMNFGGGWKMRDRPASNEVAEYRALFETKRLLGGLSTSDVRFPTPPAPTLFVAERRAAPELVGLNAWVRVVSNFGDQAADLPTGSGKVLYSRLGSLTQLQPWDTIVTTIDGE